ncbi:Non-heme chloroperoxidase [Cyphellophora attinorum]|uniref:Non-heme chloroperoxidase n=1 Tax=Cyphellophora attinorum TaxID=1664694 RepID=A0A0N1HDF5_9EURO|nr:Non-heme chloroperoxidase [Phialophora attinorum]KPI42417.1 Non-heme chloroperoxidase [Phialophora attinorum]
MPFFTVQDGTEIYYKDWGNKSAPVVTFSHGWPLSSDDWDSQATFLVNKGYRVVAHDRRGHGRSSHPWDGHNMDQYADDLYELFEKLDLKNVMMVGHSTGGGEVTRVVGRHGTSRVSKAVLISAVAPGMLKTDTNATGVDISVFDGFRAAMNKDRAQFFLDVPTGPFFGFNREGAEISQGRIQDWWRQGMNCSFKAAYDCIKAFSETDTSEDLKKVDIPILILHGTDDQVVPIDTSARRAIKLCKTGTIKEFPGAPHALPSICADEVNQALLEFLQS